MSESSYTRIAPPAWPEIDPPPYVTNVMPRPEGVREPRAVTTLTRAATAHGWDVRVGYSRGLMRAVKVGTYKTVECWGVWAAGHGWRWSAMNHNAEELKGGPKWEAIAAWSATERRGGLTITQLIDFIADRGATP
jgi:hypothetical protein